MRKRKQRNLQPIRLGFVALTDCAPVIMAHELGIFERYGLTVELHREVGWATIRDKILYGELDAAPAPAGLVVAATFGLGSIRAACLTGLVLNLHGDGITLSQEMWKRGVSPRELLTAEIARRGEPLIFGVVHQYSSHSFLLRRWLRGLGLEPDRDVCIVVVPPPQVLPNLKAGHLDGYCVGEPYNSLAVMARAGWCAAISPELSPGHPEKVLMVREDFAQRCESEHLALIAALIEACRFCERPQNRERICETLAQPHYVNVPVRALQISLCGRFDFGNGRIDKVPDFHVFARGEMNEPAPERADWVISNLHSSGLLDDPASVPPAEAGQCLRADLYARALTLVPPPN